MERSTYEDEDSSPVNGWIKKEIEDEDFDEYMKNEQEDDHGGDRYEELMNLPKEELVARILQLEEEVRYLQDIRHGLDKNVQGFSSSNANYSTLNSELKNLIESLSSKMSSFKGIQQTGNMPPASNTASRTCGVASTQVTSSGMQRSTTTAPQSQASPRSTPTMNTTTPSSRGTTNAPVTRSTSSSSTMPSNQITQSVVSTDRLHPGASMSSHETVTITRQTNFIIKTEIPSPPPSDTMITDTPMPSVASTTSSSSSSTMSAQKARTENLQQQQQKFFQPIRQTQNTKPFVPNTTRSITDIANSIPPQRQRGRGNQNYPSNMGISTRSANQQNRNNMQQFQRQAAMMAQTGARGGRGRGNLNQHRSVPYTTQKPTPVVQSSPVTRSKPMGQQATPGVNNLLANISLKVPSGITLSIVPPTKSNVQEKSAPDNSRDDSKSSDKSLAASNLNSSLFSSNANQGNFDDDDEFEEDCFEEVAVLIPDKKVNSNVEGAAQADTSNSKALVASDAIADSHNSFWNANFKQTHTAYPNNAEYMFEEADDLDSDETDTKR